MKLLFTHEQHIVEYKGYFYNPNGLIAYGALLNYLYNINEGIVVLRCSKVTRIEESWLRVNGEHIEVHPIPELRCLRDVIINFPNLTASLWNAVGRADRYVVRLPGPTGILVALMLILRGRRFGVELVGQYDKVLDKFLKEHKLGPAWIRIFINKLIYFIVKRAVAVGYRSRHLQLLYPASRSDREWIFPGVQISPEMITGPREESEFRHIPFKLVFIGRVAIGKGCLFLLQVFNQVRQLVEVPVELEIIGDGNELDKVRRDVEKLSLQDVVHILGRIPWGPPLFSHLKDAHLFVLPSESDGLPRSLIEAMVHGMPALATAVGGIPELLDSSDLVPSGDENAFVRKIIYLIGNYRELAEMSKRNFEKSKEYWPVSIEEEKRGFWECIVHFAR